jgi:AcrR family transcriptional regulator
MQAIACFHPAMPRPASPRTQRGRESRERVLDGAIELFATHGFAAVTMRAIGEAAGLDNSSLYRHFASKTDLANAVLDRLTVELFEVLAPDLAPTAPPSLAALVDAATATGRYLFDRPPVARLLMHWLMSAGEADASFSVSVRATDTRRPAGRLVTLVNDWLARGMRSGALRRHESPEALVLLIGAVLLRPATYGHLLASQEPRRSRGKARQAWERELRAAVHGAFAP